MNHPNLIVGTETFDDAGVFRLSDDLALVQTLDFFPPLVDDPFDFGRIAAANALSDVYAMGGEPITALNIVGFPDTELPYEILIEILRGGAEVCRVAGVTVLGGHSVRDAEVKFGLSVTGRIHPDQIWTNAGARPNDVLILTKPLGGGTITTAIKREMLPPEAAAEAIRVMTMLNRGACRAGRAATIHACTDVTGFGLIGHAYEMASGAKVAIEINAETVPLIGHALDLAQRGVKTRAAGGTHDYLAERLSVSADVNPALVDLLLDAQTSGGLLFSVAPDQAATLIAALRAEQTICAAQIGRVIASDAPAVRVVR
jgi:selenide,water dikinase